MSDGSNYQQKCTSSPEDNLRDRIARVLLAHYSRTDGLDVSAEESAQAVIDDLGLTVEERNNGEISVSADGIEVNYAIESRVVGKWEKQ